MRVVEMTDEHRGVPRHYPVCWEHGVPGLGTCRLGPQSLRQERGSSLEDLSADLRNQGEVGVALKQYLDTLPQLGPLSFNLLCTHIIATNPRPEVLPDRCRQNLDIREQSLQPIKLAAYDFELAHRSPDRRAELLKFAWLSEHRLDV